ncbi:polyphosphate kinase 2 family protein [Pontibacter sp. G13]|uniref:polyphosphate kinase 2 family protein n=1 Tax=Pontibacter sp. G13 TaxID=3074898 RepID=UPI00288BC229|nr:polyphosphate kinase 2 family protein [Pontibacter sp. G13]WNJ17936.1 polyphosphate kinase 2 family protein [Pontibacter sp. G13]
MHHLIETDPFRFDGTKRLKLKKQPHQVKDFYENKKDYKELLSEFHEELDELQSMMYAHNRYALLLVFQAMDAAGKDGTIQHVLSGVNPHGVFVRSFKKPSTLEIDHDFLWRTHFRIPSRGTIGIFNRSHYEEVLVTKVHPEILLESQRIPRSHTQNLDKVWKDRYEDIRNHERYLYNNGVHIVKFFLNLSRDEQRDRFLARIDTPAKNWKFSEADVKERAYWDDYQAAYEQAINETATPHAPWYVVPADDKKNMRLIVSQVILNHLNAMDIHYPKVSKERKKQFAQYREMLLKD